MSGLTVEMQRHVGAMCDVGRAERELCATRVVHWSRTVAIELVIVGVIALATIQRRPHAEHI